MVETTLSGINTKTADLHIHTTCSDGLLTPSEVVDLAIKNRLDGVAITDHEVIAGGLRARGYYEREYAETHSGFKVVVGAEITTKQGHLVGLNLEKDIPSGKDVSWTVAKIHEQGGLVIAPHPMSSSLNCSLSAKALLRVIESSDPDVYFDGCEMVNYQMLEKLISDTIPPLGLLIKLGIIKNPQKKTDEFYKQYKEGLGAQIGGSDTHYPDFFASTLTVYQGDLFEAIKRRRTEVSFDTERKISITPKQALLQNGRGLIVEPTRRILRNFPLPS